MRNYFVIGVAFLMVFFNACKKDENLTEQVDNIDLVGEQYAINGPIDQWLFDNFSKPYNIRLQYKWDRTELDLNKTMTPVDESQVIPLSEFIIKYYLKPYEEEAGEYFIKKYPAKQYVFVGSAQYQSNGTVTLGSADKGRKVVLFRLNEIDVNNWDEVERMLKTVHHEFAHTLDQNKRITAEYGQLNKADYIEDLWTTRTDQEALDLGFITRYAGSQPSDDLAEMVAVLLLYGQDFFDSQLALAASTGRDKLRKKEEMIVDYFSSQWDINFRSLQKRIADIKPVKAPAALPDFLNTFGDGKAYSMLQVDNADQSDGFENIWQAVTNEMVAKANRHIAYLRLYLSDTGQLTVRVYRYGVGAGETGSSTYSSVVFNSSTNADGIISFTYESAGSSATLKSTIDNLSDFIQNNKFVWSWKDQSLSQGGLYVVNASGVKTGVSMVGEPKN